jgi:flagellar biosynthesis GTPase FlhF
MISVAHTAQSSVFRAATAREALAAARASLGEDAVVVSTRTIPSVISGGGSVEVVARANTTGQTATRGSAPRPSSSTPAAAAARYRSSSLPPAPTGGLSDGFDHGRLPHRHHDEVLPTSTAYATGRGPWKNATDPPWTHRGPRSVGVFVGPTGAGKTTTLVKVATRAVMHHGLRPLLVTFDIWRAGAAAQLESYGRALGLETVVVESPRDMRRILERDDDMVLVDTAGRSPKDVTALERQATYASALGLHRAHLVIPATFSENAMSQALNVYSCFQIDDLIVSKIDEANGHDEIDRVGRMVRLPICAATNGQNIVEDILPAALSSGYAGKLDDSLEEVR